jgi:hypothetical protein
LYRCRSTGLSPSGASAQVLALHFPKDTGLIRPVHSVAEPTIECHQAHGCSIASALPEMSEAGRAEHDKQPAPNLGDARAPPRDLLAREHASKPRQRAPNHQEKRPYSRDAARRAAALGHPPQNARLTARDGTGEGAPSSSKVPAAMREVMLDEDRARPRATDDEQRQRVATGFGIARDCAGQRGTSQHSLRDRLEDQGTGESPRALAPLREGIESEHSVSAGEEAGATDSDSFRGSSEPRGVSMADGLSPFTSALADPEARASKWRVLSSQKRILLDAFADHPYPSRGEKADLARAVGVTVTQLAKWFQHHREALCRAGKFKVLFSRARRSNSESEILQGVF